MPQNQPEAEWGTFTNSSTPIMSHLGSFLQPCLGTPSHYSVAHDLNNFQISQTPGLLQ